MGTRSADHVTPLYPQKLALTSPTGGSRSVGIYIYICLIKLQARNSIENFYDSCLLVLQQNVNKFYSLGSISTVRCDDNHTAVMKYAETLKKLNMLCFI